MNRALMTLIAVVLIVVGIRLGSSLEVGGLAAVGFACFVLGACFAASVVVAVLDVK
jgi:hypothetical protein